MRDCVPLDREVTPAKRPKGRMTRPAGSTELCIVPLYGAAEICHRTAPFRAVRMQAILIGVERHLILAQLAIAPRDWATQIEPLVEREGRVVVRGHVREDLEEGVIGECVCKPVPVLRAVTAAQLLFEEDLIIQTRPQYRRRG